MTPHELAIMITPQVREAAERAKPDIIAGLAPMKRVLVKSLWNTAMKDGVPAANQIVIEFLITKYRTELEPLIGEMVNLVLANIEEEDISDTRLKLLHDIMEVLRTPESKFLPAVQGTLDTSIPRIVMNYHDDD